MFTSWGAETHLKFTAEKIRAILAELENEAVYGIVLRAKGIVPSEEGPFIHFDYTPGEADVRTGTPETTGRLCVIGSHIAEEALKNLFGV